VSPSPIQSIIDGESAAYAALTQFTQSITDEQHASFLSKGGCQACGGHGVVVNWSTLDGWGYTEFGTCTAEGCTPRSRALTGTTPLIYRRAQYGRTTPTMTAEQRAEEARLRLEYNKWHHMRACAETALEVYRMPTKGQRVRVVKGRKLPVGTEATVFWSRDGRVGLDVTGRRDPKTGFAQDAVFMSAANVEPVESFDCAAFEAQHRASYGWR
jgi:hypothetical protein